MQRRRASIWRWDESAYPPTSTGSLKTVSSAKEVDTMLVLSRKAGERIVIADNIILEVLEVQGGRIRLGIQAPQGVTILREELLTNPQKKPAPGVAGNQFASAQ
jgi:carbon storage regulator